MLLAGPLPTRGWSVEFTGCFDVSPNWILLHASGLPGLAVDGYFILDTGSSIMVCDPQCRSLLAGEGVLMGAGLATGPAAISIQRTTAFDIGGLHIPAGLLAAALGLEDIRRDQGFNALGVIGHPIFGDRVLDIDPDADAFRILDRLPAELDLSRFTRFPARITATGALRILVTVGRRRINAMLDTGMPEFMVLDPGTFGTLERDGTLVLDRRPRRIDPANGQFGLRVGNCRDLAIDAFRFRAARITTAALPVLGMPFLRNFRCIIDYPGAAVYLRPAREYASYRPPPEPPFTLARDGEAATIVVEDGSRASRSGLRTGMRLLAIAEQPLSKLTFHQAYLLLEESERGPLPLQIADPGEAERRVVLRP